MYLNKYKVCVYAICKNEEKFVDRWMDAVSVADLVVVVDTGSTDGTVAKLRERGATIYEASITPWRFDVARNVAMDYIPEDIDICVSNDLDEIFVTGWRQKLEDAWSSEYTRARYLFTWSYNKDGSPNKQYPMEKIHARHGFRWKHPVHEVLEYSGDKPDRTVSIKDLVLNHYPDLNKPRSQYLPLLELSVAEDPENDRAVYWLGREYYFNNMYDQAISTLQRHIKLKTAVWPEERSASMRHIAQCYYARGDKKRGTTWSYRAISECPTVREPYIAMMKMAYNDKNWPMAYAMANCALAITTHSGSYLVESENWGWQIYDYASVSAYYLGLYNKAEEYAAKACELGPEIERLRGNLETIRKHKSIHT